jgi:hypothetical protein
MAPWPQQVWNGTMVYFFTCLFALAMTQVAQMMKYIKKENAQYVVVLMHGLTL